MSEGRESEAVGVLDGRARARFRLVRVVGVLRETADAATFVLDVPTTERAAFRYRAGQFVNVRVEVGGEPHVRSYSMSSAPGLEDRLHITVKRVPGGVVSNHMVDHLRPGDGLAVTPPSGTFTHDDPARDLVGIAAGSGVTPVMSLVRTALASGTGRVALLYANRDRASTIFAGALDRLAALHPHRFRLEHHLDVERGFVSAGEVAAFAGPPGAAECFVCGPDPFMAIASEGLRLAGVPVERIHLERFTPGEVGEPGAPAATGPTGTGTETGAGSGGGGEAAEVTIRLGGRTATVRHRPGTTLLQTARFAGLRAPSSCESGSCATCMARVTSGEARMRTNEALTDDEVAGGWVLTCQAEPVTPAITVEYE